jgi:uncharacterized repeat protein (TIGR01451 family)
VGTTSGGACTVVAPGSAFNTSGNGSVVITFPTTISLTSAPNPSLQGQAVTFTATVASQSGTPTGTVTFFDNGTAIGTGTLNASGVATFTTTALAAGTHPITASYGGATGAFAPSGISAVLNQVVNPGTVALRLAPTPPATTTAATPVTVSAAGQTITYSFDVTNGGSVAVNNLVLGNSPVAPAGSVTVTSCLPSVGAGATVTCTATYTTSTVDIAVADNPSGEIVQNFTATGTNSSTSAAVVSNPFSVSVDVRAPQTGWVSSVINTTNTIGVSP